MEVAGSQEEIEARAQELATRIAQQLSQDLAKSWDKGALAQLEGVREMVRSEMEKVKGDEKKRPSRREREAKGADEARDAKKGRTVQAGKLRDEEVKAPNKVVENLLKRAKERQRYQNELEKVKDVGKEFLQDKGLEDDWAQLVAKAMAKFHVYEVKRGERMYDTLGKLAEFGDIDEDNSRPHPDHPKEAYQVCFVKNDKFKKTELEDYILRAGLEFKKISPRQVFDGEGHVKADTTAERVKFDLFIGSLDIPVSSSEVMRAFPPGTVTKVDVKREKRCAIVTCPDLEALKKATQNKHVVLREKKFQVIESAFNFGSTANVHRLWSGFWPGNATPQIIQDFIEQEVGVRTVSVVMPKGTEGSYKGFAFITVENQEDYLMLKQTPLYFHKKAVTFDDPYARDNKDGAPYPEVRVSNESDAEE